VSALASAFVDNIPLTTMMVKIAISLAENEALDLPLQPLVWALAFGACLGGKARSIFQGRTRLDINDLQIALF
jgi:Na+/H+ antiporter NhaD/arsenite permease-like protein